MTPHVQVVFERILSILLQIARSLPRVRDYEIARLVQEAYDTLYSARYAE